MRIDVGLIITAVNQASGGLNGATNGVNQLGNAARNTTQRLRAIQVVLAGIALNAARQFSQSIVKAASDLQSTQLRLAAVTGSFAKANQVFGELNSKFGPAGLDVGVLADGFVRLASSGLSLEKTKETISALANATAAFGGDSQTLQRAVIGISQVVGKGTLQMEELRQQIGEAVPVALRIMANEAGVSVGVFTQQVSKGMIDAQKAVDLFNAGAQKAFGNFAENLGATLKGSLGRIQSEFTAGLGNILANTNFDERLVEIFNNVADAVKNFLAGIDNSKIEAFFGIIGLLVTKFQEAIPVVQAVAAVFLDVGNVIASVIALIPGDVIASGGVIGLAFFGRGISQAAAIFALIQGGINILASFGGIAQSIATSISAALPIGLIGLAFLSPVGAGILVLVATVLDRIAVYFKDQIVAIIGFFDSASAQAFDRAVQRSNSVIGALKDLATQAAQTKVQTDGLAASVFSFTGKDARGRSVKLTGNAALEAIRARTAAAATQIKIPQGVSGGINTALDKGAKAAQRFADTLEVARKNWKDLIEDTQNGLDKVSRDLSGDKLGSAIADINKKFDDTNQKLTDAIIKAEQMNRKTHAEGETISSLNALLTQSNALRQQAIEREKVLFDLKQQQEQAQERINTLQLQQQLNDLKRQTDTSAVGNLLAGTGGGQLAVQAEQLRNQLNQQALQAEAAIAEIKQKLVTETNPVLVEQLNQQIALQQQLGATSLQAANDMTASALLTQQTWQAVGDTISKGVGDAIYGLITGTKSLKDVMMDVWNAITKAAIDYLLKLVEIELQEKAVAAAKSAGGGGGGGGFFGLIGNLIGGLFANGGAFPGAVKPFANGDVISGPTMFGIAGEAGDEAIMPLTRIGGKLGVRTTGGGGANHYTINIQAIDTQTGMEFVTKHIDTIQNNMQARKMLNRGSRM